MNHETEKSLRVRVLIVDDSAFMRTALTQLVNSDPGLWVAGTAIDGNDALEKVASLNPDVVTLDVDMPGLDGLGTLRRIMAECPRPVIMVSSLTEKGAETTVHALCAGAFDCVPKQLSAHSLDIVHIRDDLVRKIKAAAAPKSQSASTSAVRKPPRAARLPQQTNHSRIPEIVCIATSTGGPKALQEILPVLPADISVPVLIVQHMPPGFTASLAQRLDDLCAVSVREAARDDVVQPGVVYIAPAGLHITVKRSLPAQTVIHLSRQPENQLHTPSANLMMESVALAFGSQAMGIILTGMGEDGTLGMQAIHRHGGLTLGQDEASCAFYGMPRACAELGILHVVVPLSQIPHQILQATRYRKRALVI